MPILASLGTVNDRAFGFGDSSFSVPSYELPAIITDNAAIIYDASNPDSYDGTGTTWYDISGNNNHATLVGSPSLEGAVVNKYFSCSSSGTDYISVPSVFVNLPFDGQYFYYYMIIKPDEYENSITGRNSVWKATQSGSFFTFSKTLGSGSGATTGTMPSFANYLLVKLTAHDVYELVTEYGGSTASATNSSDNFVAGINSEMRIGGYSGVGPTNIKFLALYGPGDDPGLTNVYNALKGRFGL